MARPHLFSPSLFKKCYELVPLVTSLAFGCGMAGTYMGYALYQKPDVRLVKKSEYPPHERVDPLTPQKLFTVNLKYTTIPELEALRKEIGSYKC